MDSRRLVLGYDGGCGACQETARRIEERIGGGLEVSNLRDPQVMAWRERALGKDAPWAPTLFEVGGTQEVRAWTGRGMAVRLARALGPVATWRVMQVLGDMGAPAAVDRIAVAGMSRRQFLKGVGGAAAAVAILSGAGPFTSIAVAKSATPHSTGTHAQQNKAKAIVRSSRQFKELAAWARRSRNKPGNGYGSQFDFGRAIVKVSGDHADVTVPSLDKKKSFVGSFFVDLSRRVVVYYYSVELTPNVERKEVALTLSQNGKVINRPTIGSNYVLTQDGQKMTAEQFEAQQKQLQSQGGMHGSQENTYHTASACDSVVAFLAGASYTGLCYFMCLGIDLSIIGGLFCNLACYALSYFGVEQAQECVCHGGSCG